MTATVIFFVVLSITVTFGSPCEPSIKGYFWRDLGNKIPVDAFKGGFDGKGNPIYVGQVLHGKLLIPGTIYSHDNAIFYEYYGPKVATKNVKILCTRDDSIFEWIKTNKTNVHLQNNFIIGGYEPWSFKVTTLIGRAKIESSDSIGKVIIGENNNYSTEMLTSKNSRSHTFHEFEILALNANRYIRKEYS